MLKPATFLLALVLFLRAASAQGTRADYDRSEHFDRLIRNKIFRTQVTPHWSADGNSFWYRNDGPDGTQDFVWVDALAGTRLPAFDNARLAPALTKATGKNCDADRLPIDAIEPGDKPHLRIVHFGGKRWQVDLDTYAITAVAGKGALAESLTPLQEVHPSHNGGEESSITFDNKTQAAVSIFWVDTGGQLVSYGTLAAGERLEHNTFTGHVWVVKNQRGRTLGVFEAVDGGGDAVIQPRRRDGGANPSEDGDDEDAAAAPDDDSPGPGNRSGRSRMESSKPIYRTIMYSSMMKRRARILG